MREYSVIPGTLIKQYNGTISVIFQSDVNLCLYRMVVYTRYSDANLKKMKIITAKFTYDCETQTKVDLYI